MSYTTKLAEATCKAMGMPAKFAAEKEPESPPLNAALAEYMKTLDGAALRRHRWNAGSAKARTAAADELARRGL